MTRASGLAALAAVALAWWVGASAEDARPAKGGLPAELARVPRGAVAVFSARAGEVWNHEVGKGLRAAMKEEMAHLTGELQRTAGLSPGEVERVTVAFMDVGAAIPVTFVTTAKPYDREKVLSALVPQAKT